MKWKIKSTALLMLISLNYFCYFNKGEIPLLGLKLDHWLILFFSIIIALIAIISYGTIPGKLNITPMLLRKVAIFTSLLITYKRFTGINNIYWEWALTVIIAGAATFLLLTTIPLLNFSKQDNNKLIHM